MSNYFDYRHKKIPPTPADNKRVMPKVVTPAQPLEPVKRSGSYVNPMTVEESIATDTIIERVNAFWRK